MKPIVSKEEEATLKSLRESAGYTQERLASELGMSKSAIGFYEAGTKIPRFDNAVALAEKFGCSLKTLAKGFRLEVENVPDDVGIDRDRAQSKLSPNADSGNGGDEGN